MPWLKLTTVYLDPVKGKPKEYNSIVRSNRINMDRVNLYYEASEDHKNNPSENARFNTVLDIANDGKNNIVLFVKETVQEIDEMLGIDRLFEEPEITIQHTVSGEPEIKTHEALMNKGWGKPSSGW